jgi:hypothetical protein
MQKEATDEEAKEWIEFYISVKQTEVVSYKEKIDKCLKEIDKFEELLAYINNRIEEKKKKEEN